MSVQEIKGKVGNKAVSFPLSNEDVTVPDNEVWRITVNLNFYYRGGSDNTCEVRIDDTRVAGVRSRSVDNTNNGGTNGIAVNQLTFVVLGGQTIGHSGTNGAMFSGFVIRDDFDSAEHGRTEIDV